MKKKNVYIWMGGIVVLTIAVFTVLYFLNLKGMMLKTPTVANANTTPVFGKAISGSFENPLDKPMDVAKIGKYLYVSDTNNKRVQVFNETGDPAFMFGKDGQGNGEFKFPYGISGDTSGNVYVADLYNGKISIFDSKGKFIKYFDDKEKVLQGPAGIRIYNDQLYVTDINQSKVFIFKLSGEKVSEIDFGANKDDKFNAPNAIAIDKNSKKIFVSDSGNARILEFDKSGKYIRTINGIKDGKGSSIFVNPRGIAVDSQGILYVVDNMTNQVYGFNENGKKVFSFGSMGDQHGQFYLPNGLYIDGSDQLYITDTLNARVDIYF